MLPYLTEVRYSFWHPTFPRVIGLCLDPLPIEVYAPWIDSTHTTWELVGNTEPQATCRPTEPKLSLTRAPTPQTPCDSYAHKTLRSSVSEHHFPNSDVEHNQPGQLNSRTEPVLFYQVLQVILMETKVGKTLLQKTQVSRMKGAVMRTTRLLFCFVLKSVDFDEVPEGTGI